MMEPELRRDLARATLRVDRERRARLEAEHLAEKKTRALYDRQRELELLHRITDAANGATSLPDTLQFTLDEICAYTGWPVGHAYFYDERTRVLVPSRLWHLDHPRRFDTFRAVTEATSFGLGEGLPGAVLLTGEPMWIPNVLNAPNFPRARASADIGVVAAFAFPVLAGEKVTAVLEFFSGEQVEREETWLKIAAQTGIQLGRIFERQQSAADLEQAHRELMELSRGAGMAEVATGVLHNVGNVLNSVSVSATVLGERLRRSRIGSLRAAAALLREQNGHLAEFLTTDPRGRMLPDYIAKVAEQLEGEQAGLLEEASSVAENIEHIKSVVAMQQRYAKGSGLIENLDPAELVQDALRLNGASLERHEIELETEFLEGTPLVCADRHQVLQILINLVRNAKHALESRPAERRLTVRVAPAQADRVTVTVRDNGVGILPENLNRIFNHGFTTKADGHGFGLHSGANAAREMGGRLSAQSEGPGRGATFTLELPAAQGAAAPSA